MELEKAAGEEAKDEVAIKVLNEDLRKIYGEIMAHPCMVEYNTAKALVDQMMSEILSE